MSRQVQKQHFDDLFVGCTEIMSCYNFFALRTSNVNNKNSHLCKERIIDRALLLATIVLIGSLLLSCSGSKSNKAAIEAINKGMRKEALSLHVLLGRVSPKCAPIAGASDNQDLTTVTEYQAAQKGGLISITPDGPGFWKVELVDPKPNVQESLKNAHHYGKDGCDYFWFGTTVAEKAVTDINLHEISSEKAEAEFTWKWGLTPFGARMVDNLNPQQRARVNIELAPIDPHIHSDPMFDLADITQSSSPHPGKKSLKKSGEGWVLDE